MIYIKTGLLGVELNMLWAEVDYLMQIAADRLDGHFGRIVFDKSRSVCDGEMESNGCSERRFIVGVSEMRQNPDKDVLIGEAMIPLVGLFHEVCGHGGQVVYEYEKTSNLSRVIALNHYACKGAPSYYGVDSDGWPHANYFKQPYEIAAQYSALKAAYSFLSSVYDENEAYDMLKSYVDFRIERCSEFIPSVKGCSNMHDVLVRFDRSFSQSVNCHREYDIAAVPYDYLHQYARQSDNPNVLSRVSYCRSGFKQDFMLASVYLNLADTDYVVRSRPVFCDLNLNPKDVFKLLGSSIPRRSKKSDLSLDCLTTYDDVVETDDDFEFS